MKAVEWLNDHAEDETLRDGTRRLWVGGPGDPQDPMPGSRGFVGRWRFVRALAWLTVRRPWRASAKENSHDV